MVNARPRATWGPRASMLHIREQSAYSCQGKFFLATLETSRQKPCRGLREPRGRAEAGLPQRKNLFFPECRTTADGQAQRTGAKGAAADSRAHPRVETY